MNMTIQPMFEKVKDEAQRIIKNFAGSHDWDHTERVYKLCDHIGSVLGADRTILRYAAVLHDIGRKQQDDSAGKICHARAGAEMAQKILESHGMDPGSVDKIIHCIKTHRFRGTAIPESLEAKVLFDADKLDSIGAVGIGRAIMFSAEIGAKLHNNDIDITQTSSYSEEDTAYREYMVKLRFVKDKLLTAEGKRIAEGRHDFMEHFFHRLQKEVGGEW